MSQAHAQPYTHLTADFIGVPAEKLHDQSLVSGLVIAAAGAVGLNPAGAPVVRLYRPIWSWLVIAALMLFLLELTLRLHGWERVRALKPVRHS